MSAQAVCEAVGSAPSRHLDVHVRGAAFAPAAVRLLMGDEPVAGAARYRAGTCPRRWRPAPAAPHRCRKRNSRPSARTRRRPPPARGGYRQARGPSVGCSRERPSLPKASTICAVTSTDGGSSASPKSQNGNLRQDLLVVVLVEGAPAAGPALCMAISQSTPRRIASSIPFACHSGRWRKGASAISATAVSSVSG